MNTTRPTDQSLLFRLRPALAAAAAIALIVGAAVWLGAPRSAAATSATGLSTVKHAAYHVQIGSAALEAGKAGTIALVIEAKGDFKVNKQYPHKVKLQSPPDGLTLPKKVLRKGDGKLVDAKTLAFSVPVRAERSGSYQLRGTLKFGVCTDERCLIEKVPFTAQVEAN